MFSCESDLTRESPQNLTKSNIITFVYNDMLYTSTYDEVDSTLKIDNEKVAELYFKLNELPNLATYLRQDGLIEYFDNSELAMNKIINTINNNYLRNNGYNPVITGKVSLYSNANLNGEVFYCPITLISGNILEAQFGSFVNDWDPTPIQKVNFNDKTTSCRVDANSVMNGIHIKECVLTLYENYNFKGKSIIFKSSTMPLQIYDLENYTLKKSGLFNHSKKWNRAASSLKIRFTTI